jgi:four helix bundle protein
MSDFKKLRVGQKAHEITLIIYRETQSFPNCELYGLVSQMRRSCVSIGSNIAEGCGRVGEPEKARFLQIAVGSLSELEYQLIVSHDLGYFSEIVFAKIAQDVEELGRMLGALVRTINEVKMKKLAASSQ